MQDYQEFLDNQYVNRMLKIVALDFCDPKLPVYCLFMIFVKLFLKLKYLSRIKFDSSIPVNVRVEQGVSRYFETTVGMINWILSDFRLDITVVCME